MLHMLILKTHKDCISLDDDSMEESLASWLRKHYPLDILMPIEKGSKRPAFSHKNDSWSWYRYLTKYNRGDVGILLIDLCVIDVDCHSVAKALEERFEILKMVPCEETTKGCHYYFSRSKKADVEGYYDAVKPQNAKIDFKTRCSNGTSGLVAVSPSTGKMWKKDRAPWMCYPGGEIPEIPDDLLEHVGRARHSPISCSLHFLVDGEVRHIESCNLMAGSAYIDIFVRDPLDSFDKETKIIPVPNCRASTFDEMLHVCAYGELCLSQEEVMDSSPEEFRRRITTICELADFFGMPNRYDTVFRAPYGYLWGCIRLHELSKRLNAVSIVESLWRYRLGTCIETETQWRKLVVEVTPELAKKIRYQPVQACRDSFLFYKRKSMASLFDAGAATIHSDRLENIEMPSIISTILDLACGRLMLAGGSLLGEVAIKCSRGADYDLFFFGIDAVPATELLEKIISLPNVSELHRSEHAITFGANDSIFQVITRLFRNPAEILHGFDISACKIGLYKDKDNRANLLATPSWVETMTHRAIWVDERTWSRSSAVRLCKYYCKGFDVLIPGLVREALDKGTDLRRDLDTFDGITLLFALEHQLDKQYENKKDFGARIISTWLEKMVLRMKRHRDCDYTSFMKTTKLLHSWWNWFSSKNIVKVQKEPVLVWSTPRTGNKICGTFAQCPSNLKDILLL